MKPLIIGGVILGALMVLKNKGNMSLPGTSVSNIDIGYGNAADGFQPNPIATINGIFQQNALGSNDAPGEMTQGAKHTIAEMYGATSPEALAVGYTPAPFNPEHPFGKYSIRTLLTPASGAGVRHTDARYITKWVFPTPEEGLAYMLNSSMGGGGSAGAGGGVVKTNTGEWVVIS